MKQLSLFIFLLLLSWGMEIQLLSYYFEDLTAERHLHLFLGMSGTLLYLIPILIILFYLSRKLGVSFPFILLALFVGWSIAAPLSMEVNTWVDGQLEQILSADIYQAWIDTFSAPFAEEFLKASTGIWVLFLLKEKRLSAAMLVGAASGLGFQLAEDMYYIAGESYLDVNNTYPELINRLSGALASHWLYTSIVVVGIMWLIQTHFKPKSILPYIYVLAPVALHFFWNSPFNVSQSIFSPVSATLSAITLYLGCHVYQHVILADPFDK